MVPLKILNGPMASYLAPGASERKKGQRHQTTDKEGLVPLAPSFGAQKRSLTGTHKDQHEEAGCNSVSSLRPRFRARLEGFELILSACV